MSLFQQAACKSESIEVDMCNLLSPKHSLEEAVRLHETTNDPSPLQHHLTGVLLNQMSARAGIKKHGDKTKEVLFSEFLQLNDMRVF